MLSAHIGGDPAPHYRIAAKTRGRTGWRALILQLILIALLLAIHIYMFAQPLAHGAQARHL